MKISTSLGIPTRYLPLTDGYLPTITPFNRPILQINLPEGPLNYIFLVYDSKPGDCTKVSMKVVDGNDFKPLKDLPQS